MEKVFSLLSELTSISGDQNKAPLGRVLYSFFSSFCDFLHKFVLAMFDIVGGSVA